MVKEYEVQVDDTSFLVSIKPQSSEDDDMVENKADSISFEATKLEYEHCIQRSEKLDNKIYIALTICAFLFVLITDTLKKIAEFNFPKTAIQLGLIISYALLMATILGIYTFSVLNLTKLLKGVPLKRFDTLIILERDFPNCNSIACVRYICSKYTDCIKTNNLILEQRFIRYNKCINCLIPIVFFSFLAVFICNFIN